MHTSILLVSALSATVFAAPVFPNLDTASAIPGGVDAVSAYFNLLASKVQQGKTLGQAPVCDLSNAQLPLVGASALPPPSANLVLEHVAVGRGTQNYTCSPNNATAAPVQIGALATLFNATCLAAAYPDLLNMLPGVALQFNLTAGSGSSEGVDELPQQLAPTNLDISGQHYFQNPTTPFFNLDLEADLQMGQAPCLKNNSVAAPANAPRGQQGEAAVPWLKLVARSGATGGLQEVYRVETAGGSAPATCAGMAASFTVQYSALYWFFKE